VLAVLDHQFAETRARLDGFADRLSSRAGKDRAGEEWRGFLKLLSGIYGGERYLAVREIMLGTRGEPQLHAAVLQHRLRSLAALEAIWLRVFGRMNGGRRRLSDLMHLTLATLRGTVFDTAAGRDPASLRRQLALLEDFLAGQIDG